MGNESSKNSRTFSKNSALNWVNLYHVEF
jgi:hypothetical protein